MADRSHQNYVDNELWYNSPRSEVNENVSFQTICVGVSNSTMFYVPKFGRTQYANFAFDNDVNFTGSYG